MYKYFLLISVEFINFVFMGIVQPFRILIILIYTRNLTDRKDIFTVYRMF